MKITPKNFNKPVEEKSLVSNDVLKSLTTMGPQPRQVSSKQRAVSAALDENKTKWLENSWADAEHALKNIVGK